MEKLSSCLPHNVYNTSAGQRLASHCPEKNTHSQNVRKSIETKEVHVEADKRHSKQQVAFPHRRRGDKNGCC